MDWAAARARSSRAIGTSLKTESANVAKTTGRRAGFRLQWPKGFASSTLAIRTIAAVGEPSVDP